MKPVRLTMQAFGPFASVQVLDFRQLGDHNFFLIHGPTGSGKTTILDAMTFALFGDTSGNERQGKWMRSDHSDPALPTEVTYDFCLGSDTYRVCRRPEQERPKKRGTGVLTDKSQATLWKRSGLDDDAQEGTVVASQWNRVTAEVEHLMGFRSEQFRQVVILPQGQFRRLLVSSSGDREEILQTLFQTEFYRRIEEALKLEAKRLIDEIHQLEQGRRLVLEQAGADSSVELESRIEQTRIELTETYRLLEEFRKTERDASAQWQSGLKIKSQIDELQEAEINLQKLQVRNQEFDQKRLLLDSFRKASQLLDLERELIQRREEVEESRRNLQLHQQGLLTAQKEKEKAGELLDNEESREPERVQARMYLAQLESLSDRVMRLDQYRQNLLAVEREMATMGARAGTLKQAMLQTALHLAEKHQALLLAEKTAAQTEAFRLSVDHYVQGQLSLRKLTQGDKELKRTQDEHSRKATRLKEIELQLSSEVRELEDLENHWLTGQAAILAQQLQTGHPCPVCGSLEHPAPATSSVDLPSEIQLQKKRKTVRDQQALRESALREENNAARSVEKMSATVHVLKESLGDLASSNLAQIELQLTQAQQALQQAEATRESLPLIQSEIEKLKAQEAIDRENLLKLDAEFQASAQSLASLRAMVSEHEAALPEDLRDLTSLAKAKGNVQKRLHNLEQALDEARNSTMRAGNAFSASMQAVASASESFKKVGESYSRVESEFQRRLREIGFDRESEFLALKGKTGQAKQLESEIELFLKSLHFAQERATRARQTAGGLVLPALAELERTAREARVRVETLLQNHSALAKSVEQMARWADSLQSTDKQLSLLEERYRLLGHLSDIANGKNPLGMTFQRFVLSALLDDVLMTATKRLDLMSRGRFCLQRTRLRDDQRVASGLDLEVYDAYTGTTRPVATLSGGESFLASLSLALGLADVVQAYSGGIYLETIFVDEGFGSLDPESLDLALRALLDLQQGGRMVGIISHVPELKEQIDVRLEVVPDRNGSIARFVLNRRQ